MADTFTRRVVCSVCQLEAEFQKDPGRPYLVIFDSAQFAEKCKAPDRLRSYSCVELDLAVSIAGQLPGPVRNP
jgi:hypothetical protein